MSAPLYLGKTGALATYLPSYGVAFTPDGVLARSASRALAKDPGSLELTDAQELVAAGIDEWLGTNRAFMAGDHWQGGEGWIGPRPGANEPYTESVMGLLQEAFVSQNAVREVVRRHANGVVGREPMFSLAPRAPGKPGDKPAAGDQALIDEATVLLTNWWDRRKMHSVVKRAATTLLWAGRQTLRLYVPPGRRAAVRPRGAQSPDEVIEGILRGPVAQVMDAIYPDLPDPGDAAVVTNPETKADVGVVLSRPLDGTGERAEVSFLDSAGRTVLRQLARGRAGGAAGVEGETALNMGGRLFHYELRRDPLVTEQVRQQQRALNLALSMLPRNVVSGGFLERVLLNAQTPGEYVKDPADPTGKRVVFRPAKYVTGPTTTNFVRGIELKMRDGSSSLTTPDIKWREPVSPDGSVKSAAEHKKQLLEEASQGHILLTGEALVSGTSREQARADYEVSLNDTKTPVEEGLRDFLEGVLALAEALAGKPGYYTARLRVVVECRLYVGPANAEEKRANGEMVASGLLGEQTAMQLNGVLDVDAEQSAILASPRGRAARAKAQFEALKAAKDAGVPASVAAEAIGMEAGFVAKLKAEEEAQKKLMLSNDPGNAPLPRRPGAPPGNRNNPAGRTGPQAGRGGRRPAPPAGARGGVGARP